MKARIIDADSPDYPGELRNLGRPPQRLYIKSASWQELLAMPKVAIVGSRKATPYGTAVTRTIAGELARRGIVIVSGLAMGLDSVAHQAALEAGGHTIAVLPGDVEKIYPAAHRYLAGQLLERGGALVSEYAPGIDIQNFNFLERNRIVAGLSAAVVIVEAAERSGTLNTAAHCLEQGKTVLAVPGNITSPYSVGTNNLIKAGALPITSYKDVLEILNLQDAVSSPEVMGATAEETRLLSLIKDGVSESETLLARSGLEASAFQQTLTMLELNGVVRPLGAGHWTLR